MYFKPSIVEVTQENDQSDISRDGDGRERASYLLQPHVPASFEEKDLKTIQEEALFSPEMQERYPFIQALLHSQDSEFLTDPANLEHIVLDDPETRGFILYLQQQRPGLKLPAPLLSATLHAHEHIDVPTPQTTLRDSPSKTGPDSSLKKQISVSPTKVVKQNFLAITLEGSGGKQHDEGNRDEALAALITERAQVGSEKASGERTGEGTPMGSGGTEPLAETYDRAPASLIQISEQTAPMDEV